MNESASTTREAVLAFLREEAPLEYERLRSIVQLAPARPATAGEPPEPVPFPHARWVQESLERLAG